MTVVYSPLLVPLVRVWSGECEEVGCGGRVGRTWCWGSNRRLVCGGMGGCDGWTLCFVWSWGGVTVRVDVGKE